MGGRWIIRKAWRCGLAAVLGASACLVAQAASDGGTLAVTATVLPKNNCKLAGGGTLSLDFGLIDPSATGNATATTVTTFRCTGSAASSPYLITASDGLHASGPDARRLRHATLASETMAYSLSLTPQSGSAKRNVDQDLTITGTIVPSAFQAAPAGNYADTVIITFNP